ncbi:MAG: quinone-dependent dihydroorotate dehydrogenase [Legionellales bacterium]|nr:quinone-dependent dihydroorotate dehydrogenase [Legionellales bacterium]
MHGLLKKCLFQLDAERSHHLAINLLKLANLFGLTALFANKQVKPVNILGLQFPNPIGLAAGFDKNAEYLDCLARLGFGFLEVGTVTPLAQPGNPQPRLHRLIQESSLINCMGFNNQGVEELISHIQQAQYTGILGINIGKNKSTPNEQATVDYATCLERVYPYANYITINISSPNTEGLRELQYGDYLTALLEKLTQKRKELAGQYHKSIPLVVKISPDLTPAEIQWLAKQFLMFDIDGVIATNTTLDRSVLADNALQYATIPGGLSGKVLQAKSLWVIETIIKELKGHIPVIGVGGILQGADAKKMHDLGCALVQLYTGLIFTGVRLVKDCVKAW